MNLESEMRWTKAPPNRGRGSKIHFGQRNPLRLVVNPQHGPVGAHFFLSCSGLDPSSIAQLCVIDERGATLLLQELRANASGGVSAGVVRWVAANAVPGTYYFVVNGKQANKGISSRTAFLVGP